MAARLVSPPALFAGPGSGRTAGPVAAPGWGAGIWPRRGEHQGGGKVSRRVGRATGVPGCGASGGVGTAHPGRVGSSGADEERRGVTVRGDFYVEAAGDSGLDSGLGTARVVGRGCGLALPGGRGLACSLGGGCLQARLAVGIYRVGGFVVPVRECGWRCRAARVCLFAGRRLPPPRTSGIGFSATRGRGGGGVPFHPAWVASLFRCGSLGGSRWGCVGWFGVVVRLVLWGGAGLFVRGWRLSPLGSSGNGSGYVRYCGGLEEVCFVRRGGCWLPAGRDASSAGWDVRSRLWGRRGRGLAAPGGRRAIGRGVWPARSGLGRVPVCRTG